MKSVVSARFVSCHRLLKEKGVVKSARQFALQLDYLPQNFGEICKGKRDVPMELLRRSVEVFGLNPVFLLTGEGPLLQDDCANELKILNVVTDEYGEERIAHVPIPAQAGYAQALEDSTYVSELPTYKLPGHQFQMGTFRSFEIAGDSMFPTLKESDQVICQFEEPQYWTNSLKDHHVYVIVSIDGLVVKRIVNNLSRHRHLELHSDNEHYRPYRMNVSEIKEIWKVNYHLSPFSHSRSMEEHQTFDELSETIKAQGELLKALQRQFSNEKEGTAFNI